MASSAENDAFIKDLLGWHLDEAVDWIASNMYPEDVFTPDQLSNWADDEGYKLTNE